MPPCRVSLTFRNFARVCVVVLGARDFAGTFGMRRLRNAKKVTRETHARTRAALIDAGYTNSCLFSARNTCLPACLPVRLTDVMVWRFATRIRPQDYRARNECFCWKVEERIDFFFNDVPSIDVMISR